MEFVTGLRIGAIVLWAWLAIRLLLDSWKITEREQKVRKSSWTYFRASQLVMAFVVVFLFSPENILRAEGYISEAFGFKLIAVGVVGLHICATLMHMGLDVANGGSKRAWPAYAAMSALSLAWGLVH